MAGPDLRAIHDIQMTIQASSLGPPFIPHTPSTRSPRSPSTCPMRSSTRKSSAIAKNSTPRAPCIKAKVAAYSERLGPMNRQRLYPSSPLALPLFLPDEQDADARPELVLAPF